MAKSSRLRRPFFFFAPVLIVFSTLSFSAAPEREDEQAPPAQQSDTRPPERAAETVEVTVTAPRIEIPLKQNPAATSIIETPVLQSLFRTIAVDEALKLVPGVKVDNQADGERVHLSIRGQGILTERGTRGIKALVDGLTLNDPSGFVSDFYDVDWGIVRRIEILRGPAAGVFLLDRIELGPFWGVSLSLRYDGVVCEVDDHIGALSGEKTYKKATGRLGLTWNPLPSFGMYASWGTGFLPPGTEELANNPNAFGGFNGDLKPAASSGEEIGARGSIGSRITYDLAVFHLATDNDFGRYRISSRPLETFYGNVGSTTRYGLETSLAWYPFERLTLRSACTYSHFKYDSVQTLDALAVYKGTWLPNSPKHQLYVDADYKITRSLTAGAALEYVSSWYIDSTNRVYAFDPVNFPDVYYGRTDPYVLVHVRLGYAFRIAGSPWQLLLSGRNVFGAEYDAFTEPDPDENSYQPAAKAEWTLGLRAAFGRH